ncbi:MAG: DUF6263 family protein [Flavisolibacter sp.]
MKKILLASFLAFTISGFAQKVSNKLSFPKSGKLEVVTQTNSVISMEMMGQSNDTKVDATVTRLFDIENISSSGTTIEHKLKRLQMKFDAPMAGSQSFDSENSEDMKGEGGKAAEKALKNKFTMTLDPTGKVLTVKEDKENADSTAGEGGMMSNTISQMGEGFSAPKPGDPSPFKFLPDHDVSKGESWTDTSNNAKKVYILSDITDNDLVVTFTGDGTSQRKQQAQGMEIVINSKDKINGKILLDRKTGLLKQKTETTDSEGTMEVMGQSVPIKSKTTRVTTVKSL